MSGHHALSFTTEGLRQRLNRIERRQDDQDRRGDWRYDPPESVTPLPFHWSGPVADLLNMRAGPGWFDHTGSRWRIVYLFDSPAAVTVEWEIEGLVFATHSPNANTTELVTQAYAGEGIMATVLSDAGAEGFSAFVYLT